jgi:type IV secretion system protein VirD4
MPNNFIKDGKNEFRRDKPERSSGLGFSLAHKLIPFLIVFISIIIATQFYASRINYNPSLIGYPWFVIADKYPFYYPYVLIPGIFNGIRMKNNIMGGIVFNSIFIIFMGTVTAIFVYHILSWARTAISKNHNIHGTSRWANKKDIKAIGLYEESGVVLGQEEDAKVDYSITGGGIKLDLVKPSNILRHSGQTSTIMFAPTRSGKGVSSVIPTCLDWEHSLITIDPKGENFNITAGYRSKFSNVLRLSPVSNDTLKFNILDELTEDNAYRDASMIADILATPSDGKVDGNSKHWVDTAKDLITGAILHCKCSDYRDKSLYGVLNFLSQASKDGEDGKNDKGMALLDAMINAKHCTEEIHHIVENTALRNKSRPDNERGSIFSTAVTALQIFEDPMVRNCSSSSDFCLNDFKVSDIPISLYITVPFPDLDRLSSFIRILVTFILRHFSKDEVQFGEQKLKHPILFLIDEFPTLGTFTTLETMMGILAGYGITFYLICQSPSQIYKLYGEHTTIFDHCKFIMTYAMSDPKGAKMFSDMVGIESVTFNNNSISGSKHATSQDNISTSEQTQQRSLLNADELQHLPGNQLVIFPQGSPAIMAKKNVYYSDERYTSKINLPKPKNRHELLLECKNTTKPDQNQKQWFHIPEEIYMQNDEIMLAPLFTSKPISNEEIEELSKAEQMAVI